MNKINPFYILGFLVVILFFTISKVNVSRQNLQEAQNAFNETETLATKVVTYKEAYGSKTKVKKEIQKFLRASVLSKSDIKQEYKKSFVRLSSNGLELPALNYLMGQVLNKTLQIRKLKIKRQSKKRASFEMEIVW